MLCALFQYNYILYRIFRMMNTSNELSAAIIDCNTQSLAALPARIGSGTAPIAIVCAGSY
jgi:hypothetical protein